MVKNKFRKSCGPSMQAKPNVSDNSKVSNATRDGFADSSAMPVSSYLKDNKVINSKISQNESLDTEGQSPQRVNQVSDVQFIHMTTDVKLLVLFKTNSNISAQMDSFMAQIKEVKFAISAVETVQLEVNILKTQNINLHEKVDKLKEHNQKLEKSLKRNNLVLLGLNNEIDIESLAGLLPASIGLKAANFEAIRLGSKQALKRPILLKFATCAQRDDVYKNKTLLKGSPYFLQPDYNEETIKKRYNLRQYLREIKQSKVNCKPYIIHDKLFYDDIMIEFDLEASTFVESKAVINKTANVSSLSKQRV